MTPSSRVSTTDGTPIPLPLPQAWRALAALCIGFFMILLDQTIVAVATPAIQAELHASYSAVIWVTSIYLLAYAVPLVVTGKLGDRFGQTRIYLIGMAVFTIASLLCGLAPTVTTLIAARALQGLGAALLTPQTAALITLIFPRHKRGAAMGMWGATAGLSTLAGPLLGGIITGVASWNWVFFINVPLGLLSMIMVRRWVPHFAPSRLPLDMSSVILSLLAMTALIYALQEGESHHWGPLIWALLAVAVLLTLTFIRRQRRIADAGKDPLVPLELFRRNHFRYGCIAMLAMGFTVAGMMVPTMLYLQQVHGYSSLSAGLIMVPMALIAGVLAPFVGRAVDLHDPSRFALLGFSIMVISVVAMVIIMRPGIPPAWLLLPMTIQGFGHAFVWSPNSTLTLRDLPGPIAGAGSGVYNTVRQLGAVTGTAMIGAVLLARMPAVGPEFAFGQSLIPAALMLLLGVWAAYRGMRTSPAGVAAPPSH